MATIPTRVKKRPKEASIICGVVKAAREDAERTGCKIRTIPTKRIRSAPTRKAVFFLELKQENVGFVVVGGVLVVC